MKKKGSAVLTVIGAVSILIILAFSFISSRKEKVGISKLMSNEKKAEALAESASDYILKVLRKNSNIHDKSETNFLKSIYYLLRVPLKAKGTGDNFALDISNIKSDAVPKIESIFDFNKILESTIEEIGWKGKVKITSSCELVNAEYFTPDNPEYKVTTINYNHLEAEGKSAKFLDDDSISSSENESDWKPSNWELRLKFPSGNPTEEKKSFKVKVRMAGVWPLKYIYKRKTIDIICKRTVETGPDSLKLDIDVDTRSLFGVYNIKKGFDIQEKMNKADLFPNISPKTLQGLKNGYSIGGDNVDYEFNDYVNNIKERKTELSNEFSKCVNGFNFDDTNFNDNCYYIEKGAVLRINTNIKYKKSGIADDEKSPDIEKTLVTEIPFKVSDTQPIAPEYSLFIANTELVQPDKDVGCDQELGEPIDMNNTDDPTSGSFIVHNNPISGDKIDYQSIHDGEHIPGMIRINTNYNGSYPSDKVTKVKSFLGLKDMPEATEANKFCSPFNEEFSDNKFNTRISFCWDNTTPQRYHELEFPLLFETDKNDSFTGLENFANIFNQAGNEIISVPTLLFGTAHMEYPLGIRPEGPIDTVYSRTRITCKPDATVDVFGLKVTDKTKISYVYEPVSTYSKSTSSNPVIYPFGKDEAEENNRANYKPSLFGMQSKGQGQDFGGYQINQPWKSNSDFKYCPANCYDTLQYAKKATKYYEKASEFLTDLTIDVKKGGLKEGDFIRLNGVYYIKLEGGDTLKIDDPIKYKGNGLIVCKKGDIEINSDITREDNTSTLGIIARVGQITFKTNKVMASCFSNFAPFSESDTLEIYGNLVCNNFNRSSFSKNVRIYYDNTICNVTPFASLRKIGKFEPKRYAVTFADNWSKFAYEKK